MKILNNVRDTMEKLNGAAEEASDAMALQTAVLLLVGVGVIVAIGVGVSALIARPATIPGVAA